MCWFVPLGMALGASAATAATTGAMATATVASLIGAGVGAYSQYKSGESQKEAADYNAEMGRMKVQEALQRGAIEGADKRQQARRLAAAQAEGAAMSGVEINSGTPLALLTETAGLGELNALRATNNASREAWGYKAQANLDEFSGRAAQTGGRLNAAGTFLGGASQAYLGYRAGGKGGLT